MMRSLFTIEFTPLLLAIGLCSAASADSSPDRPNVVYILADDLGYGDVGAFHPGSKIPTPNVDRLARQGIRFTDAHSPSAVCTPTRYGLLTGRYAWRTKLQRNVLGPFSPPLISEGRLTVPAMLKKQGYATACIGKWHLGWDWPRADASGRRDFARPIPGGPTARGFDRYFGTDVPNYPPYCFIEDDRTVGLPTEAAPVGKRSFNIAGPMLPGWDLTDILPELERQAVAYIDEMSKSRQPFFLYLPLTSPHYPVVPSAEFRGRTGVGDYGDFVAQTDRVVGRVLDAIEAGKIAGNTLVIFTSDNGPEVTGEVKPGAYDRIKQYSHASMGPFRGVKRDVREGGHRVPFVASWPGRIRPGSTSAETICHVDLMATLAALLDVKLPADAGVDSVNILPALLGRPHASPLREATVHHSARGNFAIRRGEWVLILAPDGDDNRQAGEPPWFRTDRGYAPHNQKAELYNLARDPSQKDNLYSANPALAEELVTLLRRYVQDGRSTPGPRQANDVEVVWDHRAR